MNQPSERAGRYLLAQDAADMAYGVLLAAMFWATLRGPIDLIEKAAQRLAAELRPLWPGGTTIKKR